MNIIPKKSRSVVLQADFLNGLEVIRVCKKSHHFKDVRNRKKKRVSNQTTAIHFVLQMQLGAVIYLFLSD